VIVWLACVRRSTVGSNRLRYNLRRVDFHLFLSVYPPNSGNTYSLFSHRNPGVSIFPFLFVRLVLRESSTTLMLILHRRSGPTGGGGGGGRKRKKRDGIAHTHLVNSSFSLAQPRRIRGKTTARDAKSAAVTGY
jgi:hypothetical protein